MAIASSTVRSVLLTNSLEKVLSNEEIELEDAFENATDAASGWVLDELEEGNVVPKSSDYDSVERREARIIWIVQNRSQKAHGRAHQTDCGTDYGRLKQNRMRSSGVKHLTGKFEGAGTSHYAF